MAVMTTGQRREAWQELMEDWSKDRKSIPMTKDVLLSGIDAIDQWISDQGTSFNNALPIGVRTALTAEQKVDLFMFVLNKRRILGT